MKSIVSKINDFDIGKANAKKVFLILFILYVVVMLPIVIAFYPAMTSVDFLLQVEDFLAGTHHVDVPMDGKLEIVVEEGLSAHHPIAVTLLYGSLTLLGMTFSGGDANIGLFLCQLFNLFAGAACLSFISCKMFKLFDNRSVIVALVIIVVFPFSFLQILNCGKDSLFAMSFAIMIVLLVETVWAEGKTLASKKYIIGLSVISTFCVLTRVTATFIVIPTLIVVGIVYREKLKSIVAVGLICILVGIVPVNIAVSSGLLLRDDVFREACGNMFQQTAAYSLAYPDEQTEEEKEAINKVLIYDNFETFYDPDIADGIKFGTYRLNEKISKEDENNYLKVYIEEGSKHPEIYATALFDLLKPYVIPAYATGYEHMFFTMDDEIRDYFVSEKGIVLSEEDFPNGGVIEDIQSPEILSWLFEHGKAPAFRMNAKYFEVLDEYMQTNTNSPMKQFYQMLPYTIFSIPIIGTIFSRASFALYMPLLIMLFSVLRRRKVIVYIAPIILLMLSLLFCPCAPERYIAPLIIADQFLLIPLAFDVISSLKIFSKPKTD